MVVQTIQKHGIESDIAYAGLKLNYKTDADILAAIGGAEKRQEELKRLIRIGLEEDKKTTV